MNPIVDEVKREYGGKVTFEFVNMDDRSGRDRAAELGVTGYPNLLLLESTGKRYDLLQGVVPKQVMQAKLDDLLEHEAQ
jgi:thiol-disulfide isomerase/thioredoxin